MHIHETDPLRDRSCGRAYQTFRWHRIFAQFSIVETNSPGKNQIETKTN